MHGLMMETPLIIPAVLRSAVANHPEVEIVSRSVEGPIHRYLYRDWAARTAQLAHALRSLGAEPGDRIGTLAWNTWRHMEIYYAVSGQGLICHTINPRLFPEQIAYIVNHAEDSWLFADLTFVPLLEKLWSRLTGVKGVVVMTDDAHMPPTTLPDVLCYEDLIADHGTGFDWPDLDENTASSLCYTSGTTGEPKGVLYSHRSILLHSLSACLPDAFGLGLRDCVMPVVPMFHVNAWGIPYAAPMTGAKLVMPGAAMDPASLHALMTEERVTLAAGVPTIWMMLLHYLRETGKRLDGLDRLVVGGSACPPSVIDSFQRDYGVRVIHAWGMTETSPLGAVNALLPKHDALPDSQKLAVQAKQGRVLFGVEMKIVDGQGRDLPHDGKAFGNLLVRGPWVCSGYYRLSDSSAHAHDGWFATGDVATIDPDGYMQITDRTKDVIKSGGEWISSIELENIAVSHPLVREAAVVAVADDKWGERPLLVAVLKDEAALEPSELRAFYKGKTADWCIPDRVVLVDRLPHTATGKLLKSKLREMVRSGDLPA